MEHTIHLYEFMTETFNNLTQVYGDLFLSLAPILGSVRETENNEVRSGQLGTLQIGETV